VTDGQRQAFLAALEALGNIRGACRDVGISSQTVYREADKDPMFAAQLKEAKEEAGAALEVECRRRALGYQEQRRGPRGDITVTERYSDACLLAMMRAHVPGYNKQQIEHSGKIDSTVEHRHAGLDKLSPRQRELVRAILMEGLRQKRVSGEKLTHEEILMLHHETPPTEPDVIDVTPEESTTHDD